MKRIILSAIIGLIVGLISIPISLIPNIFNSSGSETYNENLKLVWFLGGAIQGLLISCLLALSIQKRMPSKSPSSIIYTWVLTAIFAVVIPAPSILNGKYADGLHGWYGIFAALAAFCLIYTHWKTPTAKVAAE